MYIPAMLPSITNKEELEDFVVCLRSIVESIFSIEFELLFIMLKFYFENRWIDVVFQFGTDTCVSFRFWCNFKWEKSIEIDIEIDFGLFIWFYSITKRVFLSKKKRSIFNKLDDVDGEGML